MALPHGPVFLVELMRDLSEAAKTIMVTTHDFSQLDELQVRVALLYEFLLKSL